MMIFGHSAGTALVTLLVATLAVGCLFCGGWGLAGRAVWLPDSGPLDGALVQYPEGHTATGRNARLMGGAFLVIGVVLAGVAVHVWRANAF